MLLKLRNLGMASIAALSISLLAVAGAQAVEFHSSAEHTIIEGSQSPTHVYHVASGFTSTVCANVSFQGTFTGKTMPSLLLVAIRSGCKDAFGRAVLPECEGTPTKLFTTSGAFHTSCEGVFRETYGACTYTYKNQEVKGVSYKNLGGTKGIEVTFNATPFHIVTSGGFFNCFVSDGTKTAYTYTGTTILKGIDTNGNSVELWVE